MKPNRVCTAPTLVLPPPRKPTNVNDDVKMEAIMGVIHEGKMSPAAAKTNLVVLVEPLSMKC